MDNLLELLREVKQARKNEADAAGRKKKFLADKGVIQIFDDVKYAKEKRAASEKELRERVLEWVEKNPTAVWSNYGVKFRTTKKLNYSPSNALEWCKENFKAALTVDKGKFEKYVKSAEEKPDFVEVVETLGVTIPSDLSEI